MYGARPLRRFIQHEVETRIGRALLAGDVPTAPRSPSMCHRRSPHPHLETSRRRAGTGRAGGMTPRGSTRQTRSADSTAGLGRLAGGALGGVFPRARPRPGRWPPGVLRPASRLSGGLKRRRRLGFERQAGLLFTLRVDP
nr:hypothetical protein [Streptomyces lateritius]